MSDPLSDVVRLLRPRAVFSKGISGAGRWAVRYSEFGKPSFCVVLEGDCTLAVDDEDAIALEAGDFVLLPATPGFTLSGEHSALPVTIDPKAMPAPTGEVRHGRQDGAADVRLLGGWFEFDAQDPTLLASLLPALVHVRGVPRLSLLVELLREECCGDRPGRDVVLAHLIDLLLVETLRAAPGVDAPPGLLRGLVDARLAPALRGMHARPAHAWTVAQLAGIAALSRSVFFDRFTRTLGIAPMEYLLAWRMALAKDLLRHAETSIADTAERVGYGSTSTFSTAFSRHVGMSPSRYARQA
ncbi:AraC family transcriptional regulator [Lysobacter panacisoli]|uniref:AraC family transcriptional regulator n=1 Tax=Lysobacter panacisoli TaxID=1255263 RepID=A0ABP9LMK2_9GAMM|nr:AraC family transcriptional regulator [Lysobacter panacisoli]